MAEIDLHHVQFKVKEAIGKLLPRPLDKGQAIADDAITDCKLLRWNCDFAKAYVWTHEDSIFDLHHMGERCFQQDCPRRCRASIPRVLLWTSASALLSLATCTRL